MPTGRMLIAAPPRGWSGERRAALAIVVALGDVVLQLLAQRSSLVDGLLYLAGVALVVLLRQRSVTAAFVAALALASLTGGAFVLLLWISYQAGRGIVSRSGFVVAVGAALGALGGQLATQPRSVSHVLTTFLVFVALPMLAGRYVAQHERLVSTLEQNSRLRIARDMHDSIGHRLSLASIQAAALEVSDLPPQHRQAVTQLATSVRAAMDELYQMVATLRGAPTASPAAHPDAIERLAGGFTTAGIPIALHDHGTPRPLAPDASEAAYRVAQEGLTNAAKHAPGQPISVRVAWEPDALVLSIANPTADQPTPPTTTPSFAPPAGAHPLAPPVGAHSFAPPAGPPTQPPPAADAERDATEGCAPIPPSPTADLAPTPTPPPFTSTADSATTPIPPRTADAATSIPPTGILTATPAPPPPATPTASPDTTPPVNATPILASSATQAATTPALGAPATDALAETALGHGLAGLDERVRQAGGFLDHRVDGGEFRLVAMLPYAREPVSRTRVVAVGVATALLMFISLPATMVVGVAQPEGPSATPTDVSVTQRC